MCLAIPGRVEEITHDGIICMGRVNFGGVVKRVCLDYVPEIAVGDYAIVHVGFAISKIDEQTAQETLEAFRQMGVLDEELASEEEAFARAATRPQSNCPDGSCEVSQVSESAGGPDPSPVPNGEGPGAPSFTPSTPSSQVRKSGPGAPACTSVAAVDPDPSPVPKSEGPGAPSEVVGPTAGSGGGADEVSY